MQKFYGDTSIHFTIADTRFQTLNMIYEEFRRTIPSHVHGSGSYEIHYINAGYGNALINGHHYTLTPHTLYVTGPHVEHAQSPLPENPMQEYCIYLKSEKKRRSPSSSGSRSVSKEELAIVNIFEECTFWFEQESVWAGDLIQKLFQAVEKPQFGWFLEAEALMKQLLVYLARAYQTGTADAFSGPSFSGLSLSGQASAEQASDGRFHAGRSYSDPAAGNDTNGNHTRFSDGGADPFISGPQLPHKTSIIIEDYFLYHYQQLSLEELADKLGLGTRQTERLLLKHYGKTFLQKKTEAKMSAASQLLTDTTQSITSIAEDLGYSSIEHFSSAFKKYYQKSPRQYRKDLVRE